MTYLVDTNVISAAASATDKRFNALAEWIDRASPHLFLSVVTAAEIRDGIAKKRRQGATQKARSLESWWDTVEHLFRDRILTFDLETAAAAGAMSDVARAAGQAPGFADIVIAATAKVHGLTVVTRNRKHFECLGGLVLNPFESLPPLP